MAKQVETKADKQTDNPKELTPEALTDLLGLVVERKNTTTNTELSGRLRSLQRALLAVEDCLLREQKQKQDEAEAAKAAQAKDEAELKKAEKKREAASAKS